MSHPDSVCVCGHASTAHANKQGDTRCLVIAHANELVDVFDDGRDYSAQEYRYCACLVYTPAVPVSSK